MLCFSVQSFQSNLQYNANFTKQDEAEDIIHANQSGGGTSILWSKCINCGNSLDFSHLFRLQPFISPFLTNHSVGLGEIPLELHGKWCENREAELRAAVIHETH